MKHKITFALLIATLFAACNADKKDYDASGNFEADEVIVSAQQNGELLSFTVTEGDTLQKDVVVGKIDVAGVEFQREQVQATIQSLKEKTTDPRPQLELTKKQLAVQQSQLEQQQREKARTENLVKADAATRKQLDDINALIDQLQKQINATKQQIVVQETNIATQNRSIMSEKSPLQKSVDTYNDQIRKGNIINPLTGVVLTRYALQGEMATVGKALYKIANIDTIYLRAYISGTQLSQIRQGQKVSVRIDDGKKNYKTYQGNISWISDKSEFTPKTIQTKDERANLVYAMKVRVKNDGFLKIGMYGEVIL
ncbi:HlyD family secretion protein [Pinibacter aurantiacus]|uniref:HlyD family efflux transporter periplasmic adaptor subunit n=1 Tax=Pinibacter aurantiacus TaxID=2851599 RepID=A0A9E2SA03_9BACT|nr:HlyD family efflux transporter periplasmic adaptor subunit [Pinibacter aurantiacus]MBV4356095.1 HlyD family efflux transporter periplasmic adaptor subunit [Pinibacter aurantiacus]